MLNQINYIIPNYKNTMLRNTNCLTSGEEGITEDSNSTIYFREIEAQDYWVAEDIYGSSYEFSCHHCGGELENATSGYCKNDVRYCHNCAFDLFDQPKPISAYQIWKQEKDQEIATFKREEDERRRIREEREERERRYMREHQEEIEERQALREEQERARLQKLERLKEEQKEQEEQEHMYEYDYDVLIIKPEYDFECCYCGIEMTETDGYSINNDIYCCLCACEWEKQEEDIRSTRLTCEYTGPEEHDPRFNFDDLIEDPLAMPNLEESRERDEDSTEFIRKIKSNSIDESLEEEIVSIIPEDAIKLDEEYIISSSFDEAKEELATAIYNKDTDIAQELADAYIVSQHKGRFWYKLSPDINKPNKYNIALYMKKDELATKYLMRQLEQCMYYIDVITCPDDYYNEVAEEEQEYDNYDNYYTKKALCVACGEVNYAEPVYEVEDHPRMVCCDCIKKVNRCDECNIVTLDHVFHKSCETSDLCFDCYFKKPSLKEQIPLEAHLLIRRNIQQLKKNHFDVLVDYSQLANITIFEGYRCISRCHFYDCTKRIEPHVWNAEEARNYCCRRHCEYAEDFDCHCHNVYLDNEYDDDYEEATCKICNSPHKANVKSRVELRTSNEGFKPIVSAIHLFNEELCMSNILAESLVDLCEYFK